MKGGYKMRTKLKFIGKVTMIHITTYILCGMIFSTLFSYQELFLLGSAESFMRPFNGTSTLIGPVVQVIRGALFGLVLLLIKDYFTGKYAWLKLWALIAILGIINTPAPAPSSIEGIIYTQLPLEFHLKGAPEILVQTLLFSYFVAKPNKKKRQIGFIEKNKISFITTIIAGICFSLSGIVLTLILSIDIMAGAEDIGALGLMLVSMIIVFLSTKWYCSEVTKIKAIFLVVVYYFTMAIMPTAYNFIVNSPFKSPLSLVVNVVPVIIMLLFLHFSLKEGNKKAEHNI
jgi:hypothetical protein